MEQEPTPIPARRENEEEKSWHEFRRKDEQEAPKRLEEAARFLSGMISISFTIFAVRGDDVFGQYENKAGVTAACFFWLLSLLLTFLVIFPLRWRFVKSSAQDIERAHREAVTHKYRYLVAGVAFYLLALGMLAWVFVRG